MIKHFLKKNGQKIIAVSLMLLMWGAGCFCAWEIQGDKIERYEAIIVKVGKLLVRWEWKIKGLEKEKEDREKEGKKQKRWNESIWVEE